MKKCKYLIIGGGMTADAAVKGIRSVDQKGEIFVLSDEGAPPYDRPPLSKKLWKDGSVDDVWRGTEARGASVICDRSAVAIDPAERRVTDHKGAMYVYEKLLLATGGHPVRPPFDRKGMIYYRTLRDYRRLRSLADADAKLAVIGGGFIGSEIAAALAMNGKEVTLIFPEPGICGRLFPRDLSEFLSGYFEEKGVEVVAGQKVSDVERLNATYHVKTEDGRTIKVDGLVAGLGIEPNDQLAEDAGLKTDDGIVVDDRLRTSEEDIFAAGDVANFHCPLLGKRLRFEHEDNANRMGERAGRNMAGEDDPYHYLPFFYSDLFDLGYEAIGEVDARLDVHCQWREPNQKGVLFYLKEGRVLGLVFWNIFGALAAGRELLRAPGPFSGEDLKRWVEERLSE